MGKVNTHLATNPSWVGRVIESDEGTAVAELVTTSAMAVDAQGLVHGGFVFGLADYAAMVAVNDPNVVLGAADCRFLKPVKAGATVRAQATVQGEKGRKRIVEARATVGDEEVFTGSFTCFVLDQHVLEA